VRTLGTHEAGYNPLGYHTGTVWPHENSLIAAGLARYGHRAAASTIASTILQAAPYFEHRLPEVFAGYPASVTSVPVAFPTASRPQAWAAGTPLLLLSTLLDLHPGSTDADVEAPAASATSRCVRKETSVDTVDDDAIRALVTRLARPHPSGGEVIERAAILAEGADFAAVMVWITAHDGIPETQAAKAPATACTARD
jgi:hypothetical protein